MDGGKSYAAAAVVNELTGRGIPCLMRTLISLANDLFMTTDKNGYLSSLDRYRLLVLDDLGAERTSEFMYENIYQIIDYRLRSGLPMIITANLDWEEIKNPHDKRNKRIYSRVIEACHPEKINAANRRSQAAALQQKEMREDLRKPIPETPPNSEPVHTSQPTAAPESPVEIPAQHTAQVRSCRTEVQSELTDGQYNNRRNAVLDVLCPH